MLIYDGKEFRNLEEQVQKNKEDIARHYEIDRVIADLGIRVLGKVTTVQDLPTSAAAYGDAYFIGDTSQMYVWTRANELIGEMQPYWLDIGNVFIAGPEGPQGPQGPQGERGERGSRWFAGNQLPTTASEYIEGDMFVLFGAGVPQSNVGNVYRFDGYSFTYYQNIRGPQGIQGLRGIQGERGIQGPQGPEGPPGPASGIVNIVGTVTNAASLPSPSVLNDLKSAYLVGTQAPYQLYIQVGTTPANAIWVNQGYLQNKGTTVTVNGEEQATWDADSKVNIDVPTTENKFRDFAYTYYSGTDHTNPKVGKTAINQNHTGIPYRNSIPIYDGNGNLSGRAPVYDWDLTRKDYVDSHSTKVFYYETGAWEYNGKIRMLYNRDSKIGDIVIDEYTRRVYKIKEYFFDTSEDTEWWIVDDIGVLPKQEITPTKLYRHNINISDAMGRTIRFEIVNKRSTAYSKTKLPNMRYQLASFESYDGYGFGAVMINNAIYDNTGDIITVEVSGTVADLDGNVVAISPFTVFACDKFTDTITEI